MGAVVPVIWGGAGHQSRTQCVSFPETSGYKGDRGLGSWHHVLPCCDQQVAGLQVPVLPVQNFQPPSFQRPERQTGPTEVWGSLPRCRAALGVEGGLGPSPLAQFSFQCVCGHIGIIGLPFIITDYFRLQPGVSRA